ncbi:MAG: FliH/SctL family protein [Candidatus Latescibacterota bacterium]
MARIIRTARVSGPVVTLGEAERELYLEEATGEERVELAPLLEARVGALQSRLESERRAQLERQREEGRLAHQRELQEAEARWQAERERLHQQRYEEGYQAGLDAREAEVRQAVERWEALRMELAGQRRKVLEEAEALVVDLAIAVAQRITRVQVETDPSVVARVVHGALQQLSDTSEVEIKVHPDDLQVARRFARRWAEKAEQETVLRVRPAEQVGRGGCMVEGAEENVDARLEEQMRVLHQALRAAVATGETPPAAAGKGRASGEGPGDGP